MAQLQQYLPGDPRLVDQLVYELKSKGIFDQFRKECIADVDTRPAYQNLRQRVESSVATFLSLQVWKPDLNKNQLREKLRKHLLDGNYLEQGVERIVDQVVNPKVASVFIPQVEDLVYNYLGIPRKKSAGPETSNGKSEDLLPTDLEAVSPGSVKSNEDKEMETSDCKDEKMDVDDKPKIDIKDDSMTFESFDKEKEDTRLSGISELTIHDDSVSIDKSTITIPLPAEIKLENIPAPENSPPNIKDKNIDLEKIDLPKEPNLSTDIPLPDEIPKAETDAYFKPIVLNSEDDDSSDSSIKRNMSPLTPIRNFNNENSCDAQQAFENDSENKNDDKKEPSSFRFTIESKSSENSSDAIKPEKKEEPLSYQFNTPSVNAFNTPMYDDSSNSNNLQIDYESDANSKITEAKAPEPDQNSVDSHKKDKKDDKKNSSHKSSHRSRDSHRHSSSKDKRSDSKHSSSRDSSRHDKKSASSKDKDDKSKSSEKKSDKDRSSDKEKTSDKNDRGEKKDSRESSKHRSSSHKDSKSSSHKDSKHKSSGSSSSKHSSKDDKKSSSSSSRDKEKEKSSDKPKDSKDKSQNYKSSSRDKKNSGSSSSKRSDDKENKEKKEKKETDDHYSLSGRGNPKRRSTDRDSNDGSSSSKGSHHPAHSKTTDSKKESKSSSKSGSTSSSDSTSPSDSVEVITAKNVSQFKPVVRVDTRLENPISTPPRLPFVPDVTLKKPKFAANMQEAKQLMKMRKFLEEEQKRMNQEAALLLEFQANVRPNLSQVYSSIPGPELEFACMPNGQPQTQVLILEEPAKMNLEPDIVDAVDMKNDNIDVEVKPDGQPQTQVLILEEPAKINVGTNVIDAVDMKTDNIDVEVKPDGQPQTQVLILEEPAKMNVEPDVVDAVDMKNDNIDVEVKPDGQPQTQVLVLEEPVKINVETDVIDAVDMKTDNIDVEVKPDGQPQTQVLILEEPVKINVETDVIDAVDMKTDNIDVEVKPETKTDIEDKNDDEIAKTLIAMHKDDNIENDEKFNMYVEIKVEHTDASVLEDLTDQEGESNTDDGKSVTSEENVVIVIETSETDDEIECNDYIQENEKDIETEGEKNELKIESKDTNKTPEIVTINNQNTEKNSLYYFEEREKFDAELERDKFSKFLKKYTNSLTSKMFLVNCGTYEENLIREAAKTFGEIEIVNYFKNGHSKLPKTVKNIVKNVNVTTEIVLPTNVIERPETPYTSYNTSHFFSPTKSECSFELSSDYDAKLEEMVNKTSRQEIMEIILGGVIDESPSKMPRIDYCMESNIEVNTLKRKYSEVESSVNNNRPVLTPNKLRKMSGSDQISSTTEEAEETANNRVQNVTRSKFLGKARRVGLPKPKKSNIQNSPSSDKSVENYEQSETPNGKMKATPRAKVQRYDTSDLYKPKLHYLSRRNNIS